MFDHIHAVKQFDDEKKARINVVSALSKGRSLKSVTWKGQPAWWLANEALPREKSGAML